MNYEPEVDDYVIWERESWTGILRDEGWVYFKAEPIEHKKGFSKHERYITIETSVRDKPKEYEPDLPHVNGKHRRLPYMCHFSIISFPDYKSIAI